MLTRLRERLRAWLLAPELALLQASVERAEMYAQQASVRSTQASDAAIGGKRVAEECLDATKRIEQLLEPRAARLQRRPPVSGWEEVERENDRTEFEEQ